MASGTHAHPTPVLSAWTRVYNYTSEDCGGAGCQKCWNEVQFASPPNSIPSMCPEVWVTPNFFRFEEEARQFLALPSHNKAQRGFYLDTSPIEAGGLPWRLCPASPLIGPGGSLPGGALEHKLITSTIISPISVYEVFHVIPQGSTTQPSNPLGNSSEFHFHNLL